MAVKQKKKGGQAPRVRAATCLKKGDLVMIITGGNEHKRPLQGKTGRIRMFVGKNRDRVVVEGLNVFTRHQKQTSPDKPAGKVEKEGAVHISNVMYYVEKLNRPVRLKHKRLEDGTKVRGYVDPESKEFVQV